MGRHKCPSCGSLETKRAQHKEDTLVCPRRCTQCGLLFEPSVSPGMLVFGFVLGGALLIAPIVGYLFANEGDDGDDALNRLALMSLGGVILGLCFTRLRSRKEAIPLEDKDAEDE